jgi:hypothetical protein
MRLIAITNDILINPEHVSHITVRTEPNPTAGQENDHGHDYPVYLITMMDGHVYELAYMSEYITPQDPHSFRPLEYFLIRLQN